MEIHFEIISLIIFHILMAVAVSKDCKSKAIINSSSYVVLTFFFPVITGIVYACKRKTAKKAEELPENAKALADSSVLFFVLSVAVFIISVIIGQLM